MMAFHIRTKLMVGMQKRERRRHLDATISFKVLPPIT
jgi:hypothetical protein